jgi:hypothetical protein
MIDILVIEILQIICVVSGGASIFAFMYVTLNNSTCMYKSGEISHAWYVVPVVLFLILFMLYQLWDF